MNPEALSAALLDVVRPLADARRPGAADGLTPADLPLDRPKNRDHGDWASNAALKLAKAVGVNPREFAADIAEGLRAVPGIAEVEVAGPGFINIRLDAAAAGALAKTIVDAGAAFGTNDSRRDEVINLEFVSANPTGPIHLGGTRWAAVGDALARILSSQGAAVTREYYFNDHGAQIDRFARSLVAAHEGRPTPEDGYGGGYIHDIARRVALAYAGDIDALDADAKQEAFRAQGVQFMFDEIKQSLHEFGVDFDVYFHENDLHGSGAVERAVARLRELGHIFEQDGAIWLRSTEFGDDRDRVIIRSNGEPAYFSGDLAYYLDKRERGFNRCIIMLGADHHGYVGRLMAMCAAFGDEPGVNLQILIGQLVNLMKDGQPVRMSKRAGTVVTLEDLVEIVGVDAARYALTRSSADSNLDVDLDVLQRRTNDNPVFYVQYAHARAYSVFRKADHELPALNLSDAAIKGAELDLLVHPADLELIRVLAAWPRTVAAAAVAHEPHRIAFYLHDVAAAFHGFWAKGNEDPQLRFVNVEQPKLTLARLALVDAVRQVLLNGLTLLGVSAPEALS